MPLIASGARKMRDSWSRPNTGLEIWGGFVMQHYCGKS